MTNGLLVNTSDSFLILPTKIPPMRSDAIEKTEMTIITEYNVWIIKIHPMSHVDDIHPVLRLICKYVTSKALKLGRTLLHERI
jgi:hypothetical protein